MAASPVNEDVFLAKFKEASERQNQTRSMWTREQIDDIKKISSCTESKKSAKFYFYPKKYELLTIGSECHIILKRADENADLVYVVPVEDHFPKLLEAHTLTGHGGRDRMMHHVRNKLCIPKRACEVLTSCCDTCTRKKPGPNKGVVVKPIISRGLNSRWQIDLIDFRSCEDGVYNWLLNVQGHATEFTYLRPLTSKHASNVTVELMKLFAMFGAP
ncbi:hypothetical protein QAD02_023039 [Eretmocerus hayati]|uniref:Uncharacterized protein n=1 Tax=Eretmocerus hayati TaxID=131215 RepID=A0ACC2PUY2_9HYME|nr:hypothetical protein QAD02_023039 [Eretmocerus hayati]